MKQFEPLTRKKDNQPVRYLIVDDSVFARKSLAKMVESFGGQLAGEAGDGCTAITEYARTNILVQSGTAMLAQANQVPATVLRLLQ